MGGSGSTKRVSFEADENDQITVVKGIRLSDSVISRMRDASPPAEKTQSPPPGPPSSTGTRPPSPVQPIVTDEEVRKRISEELAQEQARQDLNLQKRLEHDKRYVHDEISKILQRERDAASDSVIKAVLRERALTEEERVKAKHAMRFLQFKSRRPFPKTKQLEEKEKELQKLNAYYKEQVTRLEDRSAQFYKLTTEQYQKAVSEVESKFKRYESRPICAELQEDVLRCYQKNPDQTLSCSALAKQYIHCINYAKQSLLGKGG
ncbi:coiled-coil-helix-coiled-coil-helix domain containing 3a isoform X1 [Carcharodon carcharias]|uniref:coiled-coil-helix-coiled-coil-helix domain containing 3a isoform X1 n=1 Tax=Carcharodon carcharias TaxID=13397 RepID=UPI001B7EE21B|nr:coiled-coil-helix-coiled-coil-helix domain containing 3a isoform X1 [Carcharodon carcharias]